MRCTAAHVVFDDFDTLSVYCTLRHVDVDVDVPTLTQRRGKSTSSVDGLLPGPTDADDACGEQYK